jgi:hypothetical protein
MPERVIQVIRYSGFIYFIMRGLIDHPFATDREGKPLEYDLYALTLLDKVDADLLYCFSYVDRLGANRDTRSVDEFWRRCQEEWGIYIPRSAK